MADDRWLRTVPSDRNTAAAIAATDEPSRAARSTSVSRAVRGESPATRLSAASTGSTTRSPACTRRTASASCRAGVSLTTNPSAPACSARRRKPGRPNVVTISTRVDGSACLRARVASMPSMPGISTSSRATSGACARGRLHDGVAAAHLGHDGQVGLEVEQRGQGPAHQGLVVGEQQPDGHGTRSPPARSRAARGCGSPARLRRSPRARAGRRGRGRAGHRRRGRCRRRGPRPRSAAAAPCSGEAPAVPDHVGDALADRPGEQLAQLGGHLVGAVRQVRARSRRPRSASRARASSPGRVRSR